MLVNGRVCKDQRRIDKVYEEWCPVQSIDVHVTACREMELAGDKVIFSQDTGKTWWRFCRGDAWETRGNCVRSSQESGGLWWNNINVIAFSVNDAGKRRRQLKWICGARWWMMVEGKSMDLTCGFLACFFLLYSLTRHRSISVSSTFLGIIISCLRFRNLIFGHSSVFTNCVLH